MKISTPKDPSKSINRFGGFKMKHLNVKRIIANSLAVHLWNNDLKESVSISKREAWRLIDKHFDKNWYVTKGVNEIILAYE